MSGRGVRVETQIEIGRPPRQVFDYVSTPALWHTWHPATVEVRDVPNRPLTTAETAGCRFHRTLEFSSKRWPWRMLDSTVTRWILDRQSSRALFRLKQVLER